MKMDNTLSDVEFGDSDSVGALIIGGACVLCGAVGFIISKYLSGAKATKALEEGRETRELLNNLLAASRIPATNQVAAPAPAA